ncbi:MAG: M15 family metallopeptidase [Gammaproteobacteria bacterium]|jgi:D-alanyl-D-alanine carboxypeptidase
MRRRKSTEDFFQRLRKIHRELGIPDEYIDAPRLPLCVEPGLLIDTEPDYYQRPQKLVPAAHEAWLAMRGAARRDGVELLLISAFRGIDYQRDLIRRHLEAGRQLDDILRVIAAPGFSEHHTGRALDLASSECIDLEERFEKTIAFQWLERESCEFGFTLSYPRHNPFGIAYEPWHWCFHDQD